MDERVAVSERADPSNAEALAALDQLDGAQFSSIAFVTEDETVMAIGGGGDGAFVVSITLDDDARIYTLIDPTRSEDHDQDVVVGGQAGSYQQYQCVDRDMAKAALLYFQQEGQPSPDLKWVSE
ncbi:Imm1 family immunity protein [Achromobacter piechaudii]|uniref:Imm1 family immunity protein n=1 Tax=Achromobacter piechaudii TaxID=72556 RepID=UPI001E2B0B74|nr:Imm1 family immunity protein [Achromobacter piechaudii]